MENKKILYISQEITPFLPETEMSLIGRHLPQGIQESGKEVRVFMPRFGTINERRNQLHEVIRLSGMNLIIDDTDHSLIIKVTSIQQARMQVYFIDNEEYFKRKFIFEDENDQFFEDNDERMIFFNRGAIETTKKLRWTPDIIHCHGWFSALSPVFIKRSYKNDPLFKNAKIVYSIYDDKFTGELNSGFKKKLDYYDIKATDLKLLKPANYINLQKTAIDYSDALIMGNENICPEITEYAEKSGKKILPYKNEDEYIKEYNTFYNALLKK
ncbi:MAG: glycogen/starch synthase [Bacteroidales bacterium]|nr:glycogen/starch synthase [Bacteroidales bacterium]